MKCSENQGDRAGEPKVAVAIPAFNVARLVHKVIANLPAFVAHVVVVDDQSSDATAEALAQCNDPRLVVLRHRSNLGVGGAMLTAYAKALELGADIVVKMDGDDQMDPAQIRRLIGPLVRGEADYSKGNRFQHLGALHSMPALRRLGNYGLSFLTKLASGYWQIFDPTNGFTAIHRRALRLIDAQTIDPRYFFETSMLFELRRLGAVVCDVPMPARYGDEASSLSVGKALFEFFGKLLGGFWRRLRRQYFRYDFNAASLLIVLAIPALLFGATWGAAHWYRSVTSNVPATTGTVLIAVLPIVVGFQFILQALAIDVASFPRSAIQANETLWDRHIEDESSLASLLRRQPERLIDQEHERACG
ncbi:MAG: glycosyltransferase family 2 protein [Deltaproteobacteria bacterium]|nr:glycosyltransferase family 2 protein [Deltaproteobacteria bacterium]